LYLEADEEAFNMEATYALFWVAIGVALGYAISSSRKVRSSDGQHAPARSVLKARSSNHMNSVATQQSLRELLEDDEIIRVGFF
jgi:hypothetical protein